MEEEVADPRRMGPILLGFIKDVAPILVPIPSMLMVIGNALMEYGDPTTMPPSTQSVM